MWHKRWAFFAFVGLLLIGTPKAEAQYRIEISGPESLVRVGMNPHPIMTSDSLYADILLRALEKENVDSIAYVCDYYRQMASIDSLKEKSYGSLAFILNHYLDAKRNKTLLPIEDVLSADLYDYFTENKFQRLKHYLTIKYELNKYRPKSIKEYIDQRTFYDDLLMFNDPTRESWDCTETIMSLLPVNEGDKVIDIGCGFGYNTLRIAEKVGKQGMVYGTDTEKEYVNHVNKVLEKHGITHVRAVETDSDKVGVDDVVDAVFMSSLYHIIYTWSREDERKSFMASLHKCLKHNGMLVIVDNNNLHGEELNNCHVDPRVVEAQLGYYGFEKVSLTMLSKQRYMLVMRFTGQQPAPAASLPDYANYIDVTSAKSIVHIGSLDSYDITEQGIAAAQYVYEFIGGGKPELAQIAVHKYEELIPSENFGGEYSALQWICELELSDEKQREEMLRDPLTRSFYHTLADDNYKVLRYYLLHKYKLETEEVRMRSDSLLEKSGEVGRTHRSYLEDYILALNPNRPKWEHTESIIEGMHLTEGETIADIGCGSGYFTYRFSKMVGQKGKVFGLELKDEHISSLQKFLDEEKITNVEVIKGNEDSLVLPQMVDKMFMCSLYHIMYGVTSDKSRDTYLTSLVKSLKMDGELIIVDNSPVDDETLPYHGPYISKELIIKQLSFYGLELTDYRQIIPQRFMLTFKKVR